MDNDVQKGQWKIEVNDRYQRVIGTLISLASGVLVLPTLFLKDILPVPKGDPVSKHLTASVYWGWVLLCGSVFSGVLFYYLSAKWVKHARGQKTTFSGPCLEKFLDWSFWATALLFIAGLVLILWFISTFNPRG